MSDTIKINAFTYGDINEASQKIYDSAPKNSLTGTHYPIYFGYRIIHNVLSMKSGYHKFDLQENKHLYLEIIYSQELTQQENNTLVDFKSDDSIRYLVDFSMSAWNKMNEIYNNRIIDTVFADSTFANFDANGIRVVINSLKHL